MRYTSYKVTIYLILYYFLFEWSAHSVYFWVFKMLTYEEIVVRKVRDPFRPLHTNSTSDRTQWCPHSHNLLCLQNDSKKTVKCNPNALIILFLFFYIILFLKWIRYLYIRVSIGCVNALNRTQLKHIVVFIVMCTKLSQTYFSIALLFLRSYHSIVV